MNKLLTLTNEPLEQPGLNFTQLREEGIEYLQKLVGSGWTDYNAHDPGITILEMLCYAITDLSYRLDFDIKDLLAGSLSKQFFTAREILSTDPVTISDYRKLLIDMEGVKNAWLEINDKQLWKGIYRVLIEKEENENKETLKTKVKNKLNQYRNLCEDFEGLCILKSEEVTVHAEIEIEEDRDAHELMAIIWSKLDHFISPAIHFYTLTELLAQGKPVEDIFNGPALEHGFVDDEEISRSIKRSRLHVSDLIHVILDISGIKTIRSIKLSKEGAPTLRAWALVLDPRCTPRLKQEGINLYKNQIIVDINTDEVQQKLTALKENNPNQPVINEHDIAAPQGEYRRLSDYKTIQNEFPANYGIGQLGFPSPASPQRQAQAKQLQAYLMIFDQILANYLAQLDHAKDLLSLYPSLESKTYFVQRLTGVPGADKILNIDDEETLRKLTEEDKIAEIRKNRLLDHLLARVGERLIGDSLSIDKTDFIKNYPSFSVKRSQAAGLKERIKRLLALSDEECYLVEHILLRPQSGNLAGGKDPYSFQVSFIVVLI